MLRGRVKIMATRQEIQNTKRNIERSIQGLRTKPQEFIYEEAGGFVKPNTLYSIYYTIDKSEVYLSGIAQSTNSKVLERLKNQTLYSKYSDVATVNRQDYPKITPFKPSDSDYRIGKITRYYAQIANDTSKPIFEVSKKDYENQNVLYRYTQFKWRISGTKEEVNRDNQRTINGLKKDYPDINRVLPALSLWKPKRNSFDYVKNKLESIKIN